MDDYNGMQDRGSKKWTTMMLPEHKEQLKLMWSQNYDSKRPVFDEQQLDEFSYMISRAHQEKLLVVAMYYSGEVQDVQKLTGRITEVHSQSQSIVIDGVEVHVESLADIQFVASNE